MNILKSIYDSMRNMKENDAVKDRLKADGGRGRENANCPFCRNHCSLDNPRCRKGKKFSETVPRV